MSDERAPDQPQEISWSGFRDLWNRESDLAVGAKRPLTTIVAILLWVAAFVVIAIAWSGAASRTTVREQVPYLLSGGLTSLALSVIGAAVLLYGALLQRGSAATSPERSTPERPVEAAPSPGPGDVIPPGVAGPDLAER